MPDLHQPADEAELATIVAGAAARRTPLAVEGGGTLRGLGRPTQTAATLSTAKLTGVTLYEPTEMVLSARAGTPVSDVEAELRARGQRLAFEPPDLRRFYGSAGTPTIGAVAATNLSGPRRVAAGAARDGLIGIRAVTGRGVAVKSGGRVMKNVTGLDLVKFLAGSLGTLAVMSEVTFKVLPTPEVEATLVYAGLDDQRAVALLSAALGSPFAVTGAAHAPDADGGARTWVRIEGFADSVRHRLVSLADALGGFGTPDRLDGEASAACWRAIRDLDLLAAPRDAVVWRISVKPTDGPRIAAAASAVSDCRVLYDWGGGLVWIACNDPRETGAVPIRRAVGALGGHATLFRAPDPVRLATDVFEPPSAAVMAISRKLKEDFDPAGVLNPGRLYPSL